MINRREITVALVLAVGSSLASGAEPGGPGEKLAPFVTYLPLHTEPDYSLGAGERLPLICQRKQGKTARFTAVLEPYRGKPRLKSAKMLSRATKDRSLLIQLDNGASFRVFMDENGSCRVETRYGQVRDMARVIPSPGHLSRRNADTRVYRPGTVCRARWPNDEIAAGDGLAGLRDMRILSNSSNRLY